MRFNMNWRFYVCTVEQWRISFKITLPQVDPTSAVLITCANEEQSLLAFPGKNGSFSGSGALSCEDRQTLRTPLAEENVSLTLHPTTTAGVALRCGRPAGVQRVERTSAEDERRWEVERLPALIEVKQKTGSGFSCLNSFKLDDWMQAAAVPATWICG